MAAAGAADDKLLFYLEKRLATVDVAPATWGSPESLELQTLLLLEVYSFLAPPSGYTHWKSVRLVYIGWIRSQLPGATAEPLWLQLDRLGRAPELPKMLGAFRDYLRGLYESDARPTSKPR